MYYIVKDPNVTDEKGGLYHLRDSKTDNTLDSRFAKNEADAEKQFIRHHKELEEAIITYGE